VRLTRENSLVVDWRPFDGRLGQERVSHVAEPIDRFPVGGDDGARGTVAFHGELVDIRGVDRIECSEGEVIDLCRLGRPSPLARILRYLPATTCRSCSHGRTPVAGLTARRCRSQPPDSRQARSSPAVVTFMSAVTMRAVAALAHFTISSSARSGARPALLAALDRLGRRRLRTLARSLADLDDLGPIGLRYRLPRRSLGGCLAPAIVALVLISLAPCFARFTGREHPWLSPNT
jgi:hypothetical protein